MITNKSVTAIGVLAAIVATTLAAPLTARASEEGKRNTTLGLGAGAAALLLTQKNKLPGALVGAGAVYSAVSLNNDINKRHQRARRYAENQRYQRGQRMRAHRSYNHKR